MDDLYQTTASYLEGTQRSEVEAVLAEFADVFAHSADNLGRTNIIKYKIHRNGSENPRRLPISQRAEAEIENMLKLRVIKPSSSPWASPIVLVCKKDGTSHFCHGKGLLTSPVCR